ncbi:uncharacterized protein JCM15063_003312 [Sporobolomyces koalae]|uniref:uncharacterized protein n=1 Tax=Sporobolomyces koalae TaxID=500713 RepID=UPI00317787CA
MGRTGSPRKQSPSARTLSSRTPSAFTALSFAPSPLSRSTVSPAASTPSPEHSQPSRDSSPMAPKRTIDEVSEPATAGTPKATATSTRNKRQRQRKNKRDAIAAKLGEEAEDDREVEDGELVEGDFSDLFMFDTTPAAVSKENAYVVQPDTAAAASASPTKKTQAQTDDLSLVPDPVQATEPSPDETLDDENDLMKAFAREVAMTDDDDDDDDDESQSESEDDQDRDDDDAEAGIAKFTIDGMTLFDDEEGLKEAIEGKIIDDSSAPVAGRYYKEADLTKTCVLCGESGHTSRDCTHSQCFICGQIDVEHEARNCPVSLICSACGSRGHFARDCDIAPGHGRYGNNYRCSICQSTNHAATNCSTLWRIYDTSGPKPQKRKIVCACANCGSTKDHFIDDCLLPRGHPMKYADASAFNRQALGSSASSLPAYSAGGPTSASASRRRNGGGGGYASSGGGRSGSRRGDDYYEDSAADDDWFASRARTAHASSSNAGGHRSHGSGKTTFSKSGKASYTRGAGGEAPPRASHIHFEGFSESSRDRFQTSNHAGGSSSRSSYSRDSGGSGYDSPRDRDSWKTSKEERGGASRRSGNGSKPPSLLDRVQGSSRGSSGGGGGGGSGRKPRYQGGYV